MKLPWKFAITLKHLPHKVYRIPHYKIANYYLWCIASDGLGWEHVSVSLVTHINRATDKAVERCPTWEEMCFVKDQFWNEDECVVQYHPPKEDYISMHPHCLHLWKSKEEEMPRPPSVMVGVKTKEGDLQQIKELAAKYSKEAQEVNQKSKS